MKAMTDSFALELLLKGDYISAQKILDVKRHPLEVAYSLFLSGNFLEARKVLSSINSTRANWLLELINLMVDYKMISPTYFQIRNFLELDIDLFISSRKNDYLTKLLNYAKELAVVNKETYKLIGRILFNDKLYSLAVYYLDLYKDSVYYDPEIHFIYAKYYIIQKNYEKALSSIEWCLSVLPGYFPAKKLRSEILKLIKSEKK